MAGKRFYKRKRIYKRKMYRPLKPKIDIHTYTECYKYKLN